MKVSVFIDGFNLYHAIRELEDSRLKWLNLKRFSSTLLSTQNISGAKIVSVQYFSALAEWDRGKANKHKKYIKALERNGVVCTLGKFTQNNDLRCRAKCRELFANREEKQTDINMALAITLGAVRDLFDMAIVVTNDTDFVPAINAAKEEGKRVIVATPPGRITHHHLKKCADDVCKPTIRQVEQSRLPDMVAGLVTGDKQILCPSDWS